MAQLTWARRSPSVACGKRTLRAITSCRSRQGAPPAYTLTGPIRRPSWKIDVESMEPPGSLEPTSSQCARDAANPASSPSTKIGP